MSTPQFGESEQSPSNRSGRGKKFLRAVLIVAALIVPGSYLAVIAYVRFGGQDVKDFCSQDLVGKTATEAKQRAARSGLEIVEQKGWIRATTNPHLSRHTCHLKVDAGKVISAMAYFRF